MNATFLASYLGSSALRSAKRNSYNFASSVVFPRRVPKAWCAAKVIGSNRHKTKWFLQKRNKNSRWHKRKFVMGCSHSVWRIANFFLFELFFFFGDMDSLHQNDRFDFFFIFEESTYLPCTSKRNILRSISRLEEMIFLCDIVFIVLVTDFLHEKLYRRIVDYQPANWGPVFASGFEISRWKWVMGRTTKPLKIDISWLVNSFINEADDPVYRRLYKLKLFNRRSGLKVCSTKQLQRPNGRRYFLQTNCKTA